METAFRNMMILSGLLLAVQCQKDCDYVYGLDDRYIYEEGDSLIYLCSDGTSDTIQVEKLWYSTVVEEYPQRGTGNKTCKYSFQECNLHLRNLNNHWQTLVDFPFITRRDSTCGFMIRFFGEVQENQIRSCSNIGSGNEEDFKGYIADSCFDGLTSNTSFFRGKEYQNVFSYEIFIEAKEGLTAIHYRIYWNLAHGIIRFENLAKNPVISWNLDGKFTSVQ